MTRFRKVMLEELQRRNFSPETTPGYLGAVERFARWFGKPPDRLGPDHIRQHQTHLLHEPKLAVSRQRRRSDCYSDAVILVRTGSA